jgi:uncharacterized protein (TIGR02453 family)
LLQSSTLKFITDLKKNNNKPWFDENRPKYAHARADFDNFVNDVLVNLRKFDKDMQLIEVKNCVFRINRDVRFSKNKTPYKNNFAASFKKQGKKSIFAGYYFHLQPGGESFSGGGLWTPEPQNLKKVRQEIDYCFTEFKKIVHSQSFRKQFGELGREEGQVLVNIPKGYDKDNPAAEYLKLKSFFASKDIADKELTESGLMKTVIKSFEAFHPLLDFMNRALHE